MICFSVRFSDNSLSVLKMRFQVFSVARKKVQRFYSDKKILMSLSLLFYLQNRVFFELLIFSQDVQGNVYYVPEINLISEGTLIKAFNLPSETN